jgi:hypothetical protein
MATHGGVWPFRVKNGPKKNHDVSRDCTVAEGDFSINNMWGFTASDTGEPSADGDKSAMVG